MKFVTSFVRCHFALSTMIQSFLWFLFKRLMKARYFFPFIFGLSFVIDFPIPNAPKTQVFWCELLIILIVGREPMVNHPFVK